MLHTCTIIKYIFQIHTIAYEILIASYCFIFIVLLRVLYYCTLQLHIYFTADTAVRIKLLILKIKIKNDLSVLSSPYVYSDEMNQSSNIEYSYDTPSVTRNIKLKNKNKLVLRYLNINSLAGKFDKLKLLIAMQLFIDIEVLTETKIDFSFLHAQFRNERRSMLFRLDRNRFGGGVFICV